MTLTETYRQTLTEIANFDMSHKAYAKHMAESHTILEVSMCYKAIAIAQEALDAKPEPSREYLALTLLRNHFNSANVYPAQEKIDVGMQIINSALDRDKPDYSKQMRLEF